MSSVGLGTSSRRRAVIIAVAATLLGVAFVFVAFTERVPWQGGFELRAALPSASQVKEGDAVRVAGLDVGTVTGLQAGPGGTTEILMRIDRPEMLRADAAVDVRPRLLLEGNAAVHLRPGTPTAAPLRDGARIPAARTATAVQLDEVLSAFDTPVRDSLQATVHELSGAVGPKGVDGRSGASGLRSASRELAQTLPSYTGVAAALRGTQPGDLTNLVDSSRDTAAQLAADPQRLAALVTDFNRVFRSLAQESIAMRATLRSLSSVLRSAPVPLTSLERSLPAVRSFAGIAEPALQTAPPALAETARALDQIRALVREPELPLMLERLRPVTRSLPPLQRALTETFPLITAAGRCVASNVVPTLNQELPDGRLSTGRPAWQDLLHMAAALTGTSPGFDGNGGTLRISIAEGANAVRAVLPGLGPVVSSANLEGVNPHWLGYGVSPTFRPDAPCVEQPLPDLAARTSPGLPAGWRTTPHPRLSAAQAFRQAQMVQLLYSGRRHDRRRLRDILLEELPQSRRAALARATGEPAPQTTSRDEPARAGDERASTLSVVEEPPATDDQALSPPRPEVLGVLEEILSRRAAP